MGLNLSSTSSKVLASAALLAAAAGVAGLGTYGAFTSTTSASTTVDAATVKLTGANAGNFNLQASKMIPGDSMERTLQLVNESTIDLTAITLTTTGTSSNLLTTDGTNGLQLQIDKCPVAWTASGSTFTCVSNGVPTTGTAVLAKRAVIGQSMALTELSAVTVGKTDHLRATVSLPTAAGDSFQGLSNGLTFTFDAAIRNATSK